MKLPSTLNESDAPSISMRRKQIVSLSVSAITITLLVLLIACSKRSEKSNELSLLTWEGYVTDEMIDRFKDETGIDVKVTYIADNNEIISKLRATGGEGFDLAQPSWDTIPDAQKAFGIYQPFDLSRIAILTNISSNLKETVMTGTTINDQVYAIPYAWGTSGIIVNTQKIRKDEYSYMDLYDEDYCGRVTTRFRFPTFVATGYGLGHGVFGLYQDEEKYTEMINSVLEFLISKKECVKTYWRSRQQHIDLMAKEETWISLGWDATGWVLNEKHPHIKFYAPREGALGWVDSFILSAGAENIENAYTWINFVMTPQWGGHVANKGGFLSAVEGSIDLLPETRKKLIKESFPEEALRNINWYPVTPQFVNELKLPMEEKLKVGRN